MASLERREKSWRVIFRYRGKKHTFTVGEVAQAEADAARASTEELLRLLTRGMVAVPPGCPIEEFMFHRGKPPAVQSLVPVGGPKPMLTLADLREAYFRSQGKKLEPTTLDGIRLHFNHLARLLGDATPMPLVDRAALQGYVDRRSEEWIDPERHRRLRRVKTTEAKPKRKYTRNGVQVRKEEPPERPKRHPSAATIKKEVVSFRTAWNWARRNLGLADEFPGVPLDYAKTEEGLPFMTWEEAERRVAAGDDPEKVWDSVYLRPGEIAELLGWVKLRPVSPWVYRRVTRSAASGGVVGRSDPLPDDPDQLVLSPDGLTVACRTRAAIRLYPADERGEGPVIANEGKQRFTGIAFHPSNRLLAATSNDKTAKLYDVASGNLSKVFTWDIGRTRSVAFSPDGTLAAAGSDTGKVVVWDVDS